MRQKELAAILDIEGPSLVRLLDTLEAQGLVERCGEADDRRAKILRMTMAGPAKYRKLEVVYIVSATGCCATCPMPTSRPAPGSSGRSRRRWPN